MTGKFVYEITNCCDATNANNQVENLRTNKLGVALVRKPTPVYTS